MEHTQGEWRVINGWDKGGNGEYFPCVVMINNTDSVWTTKRPRITINESHDQTVESIMANAKLIAAAPDLLEACKAILNYAHDDSKFPDVEAKVYAAIKKATE